MPYSIEDGKKAVRKYVRRYCGRRMLDLGCGYGAYGRMITGRCHKVGIDAVDYRDEFNLQDVYDEFHVHDIRDVAFLRRLGRFDLAIAGDVLEHLTTDDARAVLDAMEAIADAVIVAFPYTWTQRDWNGNRWEDHIQDDLTPEIVAERYPELKLILIYNSNEEPWNGAPYYGYYLWTKRNT